MYLHISVKVSEPTPITPKGIIAIDVNECYVYYGNSHG